jgi:DNA primase
MINIDMRAVLEHYGADDVPEDASHWRKMKCPFHHERHASAAVVLDEHPRFRCLGCGVYGDALDLIKEQERLEDAAAIEWARVHLGSEVNRVRAPAKPARFRSSFSRDDDD